ncbi:hypothetical protein BHE74_00027761 [Ensete ventricosum]|nr:hypothetical protein BHE74_00027761 [Ensete ventricosum]
MKDLCGMRVHKDDEGYYIRQMADWTPKDPVTAMGDPEQLAAAQQQVAEHQVNNAKIRSKLEELPRRSDQADKELNELWADMADSQRQIKEQRANHRKVDDDLLKMMRENETLKAKLPSKSIADYKQLVGFGMGLRQMGQISYEYEYRVALTHFQAQYPTWRWIMTLSLRSRRIVRFL